MLLDAGADVNALPAGYYRRTALQAAAKIGNLELCQMLLDAGADTNAPPADQYGLTALQAAATKGSLELCQMLLDAGAMSMLCQMTILEGRHFKQQQISASWNCVRCCWILMQMSMLRRL